MKKTFNYTTTDWKLYFYIFLSALIVQVILIYFYGWGRSPDFVQVYEPKSIEIINWFKGTAEFPVITPRGQFHQLFIFFISFVYLLFGIGNRIAIIFIQVFLNSAIFPLILYISLKHFYSRRIAIVSTCLSFLFFENLHWSLYITPATLFRVVFIFSYFVLLNLYFSGKHVAFFSLAAISFVILLHIRPDTLVLFIPVYWFAFKIILADLKEGKRRLSLFLIAALIVSSIVFFDHMIKMANIIVRAFKICYLEGIVVFTYGKNIPFDQARANNVLYLLWRCIKLFLLRVGFSLSILPTFWSKWHKLYYAIHMVPIYILAVFGLIRTWKTRDEYFFGFFLVYLSYLILVGLTLQTASLRFNYSSLPFLVLYAGYGFDYLYKKHGETLIFRN